MDTLVLLPGFINFFGKAKNHSSSPSDLAVIFLAFGKLSLHVNDFHFHVLAWHSHCSPYASQIVYLDAVLNLAFALSLLCFLVMHASLVSSNTTSIEVRKKKTVIFCVTACLLMYVPQAARGHDTWNLCYFDESQLNHDKAKAWFFLRAKACLWNA